MTDNLGTLTRSLKAFTEDLKGARDAVWQASFMIAYEDVLPEAFSTLERYASEAADNSGEYSQPFFKRPLLDACNHPDSLIFTASSFGPGVPRKLRVFANLEETAGTIEDYAQAVAAARQAVGAKGTQPPSSAASFWRHLYESGAGSRSDPVAAKKYFATISARLESTKGIAPWWYLLSKGNAGTMGGSASHAHPAVAPSNFEVKAAEDIENKFNTVYTDRLTELTRRFAQESVDIRRLMGQVVDAVIKGTSETVKPGQVLLEVEAYGREYEIHVTKNRRLGFKLA